MKKIVYKKDLANIAESLLRKISKAKTSKAKILAMSGDLGAGKTTLTQEIAKILGIKEYINSPTFVIMKIYKINSKSKYFNVFNKLIHIDAYRLEEKDDLQKIDWNNIYNNKENLIIIEWPEKIKKYLNKEAFFVRLSHKNEETRQIEF